MKKLNSENLSNSDRATRITFGIALSLSILYVPYQPEWIAAIAFLSAYPLLTGLTAIDPIFSLVERIAERMHPAKRTGAAAI